MPLERPGRGESTLVRMGDEIGQNTKYYYCLKHHTVEREGECKATDRLGPFDDPETAARALDIIREREARLQAEDDAWED